MKDPIERQAAIDVLFSEPLYEPGMKKRGADAVVPVIYEKIKSLPPAQLEQKMGKWIQNDNGTYSCSICQSWIPEEQHYYARYCLYCGAEMER